LAIIKLRNFKNRHSSRGFLNEKRRERVMTTGYSSIILLGYLGADPEAVVSASGTTGARFSLAVNHVWRDEEGNRRRFTDWFQVVVWGPLAELVKANFTRGSLVLVAGTPRILVWDDKRGGRRSRLQVIAREAVLLDTPSAVGPVEEVNEDWLTSTELDYQEDEEGEEVE